MPVYKRGDRWYCDVQVNGQRVKKSLGEGATKAEAKTEEAQIRARLVGRRRGIYYLDDALVKWLEGDAVGLKSYKGILEHAKQIEPFVAGKLLTEAPDVAEAYKRAYQGVLRPATINRRTALLRRVCNIAWKEWGWLDVPVGQRIKMLPENNKPGTFLTFAQVAAIVEHIKEPGIRDATWLAAYTGLRLGEVMSLDASHQRDGAIILLPDTKSGKPRTVPLPKAAKGINLPIRATRGMIQLRFREATIAAGLGGVRFHDLRHTYASLLIQAGASLSTVQELLGHSSIAITKDLYGHLERDHLNRAVALLDKMARPKRVPAKKRASG